MEVYQLPDGAPPQPLSHVVLTVGSFDGVHVGHQRIIRKVVEDAHRVGGSASLLTLSPHPRQYFAPQHAPNLLTSDATKSRLCAELGLDALFFLRFDDVTANLEPEAFIQEVLVRQCAVKELVVGHDFRFGKRATGDFDDLVRAGQQLGFLVTEVPPVFVNGERVSSTLVRERLLQGELGEAEAFLGRRYSLVGRVTSGRGIGITLGFPTANIHPHHSAIPAQGVYIAEAIVEGHRYPAAVNIGIAPTIRHEDVVVEAHLLDFDGDLVDRLIEIEFIRRLRPEQKFDSREQLVKKIYEDIVVVRDYFDHKPRG